MRNHGISDKSYIVFSDSISAELRSQILKEDSLTCRLCGIPAGEVDTATNVLARLHVRYVLELDKGGKDKLSNTEVTCSICHLGFRSISRAKPTTIWLFTQIRKAGLEEQKAVFDWLSKKFQEPSADA